VSTVPPPGYVPQIVAKFEGQNKPLEAAALTAASEAEELRVQMQQMQLQHAAEMNKMMQQKELLEQDTINRVMEERRRAEALLAA
jgi:hypothetical protein